MAVPSKSLWMFYLFCKPFFKPIKCDKFRFKEMFLLTFRWDNSVNISCNTLWHQTSKTHTLINNSIYYLLFDDLPLQFGLVGHFWYAAGLVIQLFLFAIVMAEIRIKAPGAKTYLQVIGTNMWMLNNVNKWLNNLLL